MNSHVQIDQKDIIILHELVHDSRKKIKDIAKLCNLTTTATTNRIKRLKQTGVIKGTALIIDMSQISFMYPASIGINVKAKEKDEVLRIVKQQANIITTGESGGTNNLTIFFIAKNPNTISNLKNYLKKYSTTGEITVNLWSTPHFLLDNVELKPTEVTQHG